MNSISKVIDNIGTKTLGGLTGVSQPAVSMWRKRGNIPAPHCPAIERATGGAVMRWDLRPKDWHLIWPELIDRPDAPPLPSPLPEIPPPRVVRSRKARARSEPEPRPEAPSQALGVGGESAPAQNTTTG